MPDFPKLLLMSLVLASVLACDITNRKPPVVVVDPTEPHDGMAGDFKDFEFLTGSWEEVDKGDQAPDQKSVWVWKSHTGEAKNGWSYTISGGDTINQITMQMRPEGDKVVMDWAPNKNFSEITQYQLVKSGKSGLEFSASEPASPAGIKFSPVNDQEFKVIYLDTRQGEPVEEEFSYRRQITRPPAQSQSMNNASGG
ncbi:MAG: hypothetical protein H6581_03585 [Bacteroidia bacterium]|nr:hypothetical protein [Bacteroidia bacterium]